MRIKRLHLEEDASKSIHAGDDITSASYTLVDFNRGGVPLIEIVSEPDMRSSDDVKVYLEKLQKILAFSGVSDVKIEEGSMRVDCNISVRQKGSKELGTPCEIKNLGSIRSCARAVDYEFQRQKEVLEQGGTIKRQTRHWDEGLGITIPLRDKETSDDYRYFPDRSPKVERP